MNNTSIKKIFLRAADIIKVTVIYLLTFCMLLCAGIYINMRQNSAIKTNMPTEKLRSLEHLKYVSSAQNQFFCLLPVEYVVSDKENTRCCFNNNELMQTLIEKNKNIIAPLFKSNAIYEKQSSAEGEKLWEEVFGYEYFIYIKFANQFPPEIIYDAFTERFKLTSNDTGEESVAETGISSGNETADVYIYELIIISGADSYYAVSRDKNANVTLIYPPEEASKQYNSKDTIAYNINEGLTVCDFLRNHEEFNGYADSLGIKLPGEAVIFKEDTSAYILNTENPLQFNRDDSIDTTVPYIRNLFEFLDFNLEKTKVYPSNGVSVHTLQYNGTLKFHKDGLVQYNAQSETEGLKLEKLLDFRSAVAGNYTFSDKLAAACNFVEICRDFIGGAVSLQLTSVSFDEESESLVYTFSYYLNNILIHWGDKITDALTIKIKNDIITEIKFYSIRFKTEENIRNINQRLIFRQILNDFPLSAAKTAEDEDTGVSSRLEGEEIQELPVPAASVGDKKYNRIIDSFTLNYFCVELGEKMFPVWTATGN